jgi:PBP1b-binding outer membrane lipoprotein LpoB
VKKLNLLIAVSALGAFTIFGCSSGPAPEANAQPTTDKVQGQSKKLGKMNEHVGVK